MAQKFLFRINENVKDRLLSLDEKKGGNLNMMNKIINILNENYNFNSQKVKKIHQLTTPSVENIAREFNATWVANNLSDVDEFIRSEKLPRNRFLLFVNDNNEPSIVAKVDDTLLIITNDDLFSHDKTIYMLKNNTGRQFNYQQQTDYMQEQNLSHGRKQQHSYPTIPKQYRTQSTKPSSQRESYYPPFFKTRQDLRPNRTDAKKAKTNAKKAKTDAKKAKEAADLARQAERRRRRKEAEKRQAERRERGQTERKEREQAERRRQNVENPDLLHMTYEKLRQEEIKLTNMMADKVKRKDKRLRRRLNDVKSLVAIKAEKKQRQRYVKK